MATNDVPGANPVNKDTLALGCWAEHEDKSLIFVEAVEAGTVVYSIFDVSQTPPVEYRDAMQEQTFKTRFSWKTGDKDKWTWHDKSPFPWDRVMEDFPSGQRNASVGGWVSAAQRVAESLRLRAEKVRDRQTERPTLQRAAQTIMRGIQEAIDSLGR